MDSRGIGKAKAMILFAYCAGMALMRPSVHDWRMSMPEET
jgi:hypothetical protein